MLAECKTVQAAQHIVAVAGAAEHYAKVNNLSVETYNVAAEIKLRGKRQLGQVLKEAEKNGGARGNPGGRGAKIVPSQNGSTQPPTLAEVGLTYKQSSQAQRIADLPEAEFEEFIGRKVAAREEIKESDLLKKAAKEKRKQQREEMATAGRSVALDGQAEVIEGDFVTVLDCAEQIAPNSIDAIITDPPYDESVIKHCTELAKRAVGILKPGGSLLVMVGQYYLPSVLHNMDRWIRYHWTLAYLTPGGQSAQIWPRKINTFWKPVLWFVNGEYTGDWHGDVIKSAVNDNDKRFDDWGQSESGMAQLVEQFTAPGDTILDPFCGGGTTGVVAARLDRRFIGIDINGDDVAIARQRIAGVTCL